MTQAEVQAEQKREKQYNKLAEKVISKTAWGKFYGLMRLASSTGEGLIPHKVCVDKDGRILKIYKSKAGQWVGSFLKPAHEQASRDFSRKKYGRGFLDMIGFGSFLDAHDQKTAKCFVVVPNAIVKKKDQHAQGLSGLYNQVRSSGLQSLGCMCQMGYVKSTYAKDKTCKCGNENVYAVECCGKFNGVKPQTNNPKPKKCWCAGPHGMVQCPCGGE